MADGELIVTLRGARGGGIRQRWDLEFSCIDFGKSCESSSRNLYLSNQEEAADWVGRGSAHSGKSGLKRRRRAESFGFSESRTNLTGFKE